MKNVLFALLITFLTLPAFAADKADHQSNPWLKPVKPSYICMMNDKAFDKEQLPIKIDDKTYYGCCPMCKEMLQKDPSKRAATDPVSGKSVDKATAITGSDTNGKVYYFESQENFEKFASGPKPEMQKNMGGMDMKGMMEKGMKMDTAITKSEDAGDATAPSTEDHKEHHPSQ